MGWIPVFLLKTGQVCLILIVWTRLFDPIRVVLESENVPVASLLSNSDIEVGLDGLIVIPGCSTTAAHRLLSARQVKCGGQTWASFKMWLSLWLELKKKNQPYWDVWLQCDGLQQSLPIRSAGFYNNISNHRRVQSLDSVLLLMCCSELITIIMMI